MSTPKGTVTLAAAAVEAVQEGTDGTSGQLLQDDAAVERLQKLHFEDIVPEQPKVSALPRRQARLSSTVL